MSEKDREDLLGFAMSLRVDLIALSFVRSPGDITDVHAIMDEFGARLPVIAKIERPEAVEHLGAIVEAFDGLMVARGDLGVEIPLEQVPLVQKRAVALARWYARPVIVATQMLESMITHSRPTRAEASDVANAILDGTDAVMLSGARRAWASTRSRRSRPWRASSPRSRDESLAALLPPVPRPGRLARRRDRRGRGAHRRGHAGARAGRVHGVGLVGAARVASPLADSPRSRSRPRRRCAASSRCSGASRRSSCRTRTTPTSS